MVLQNSRYMIPWLQRLGFLKVSHLTLTVLCLLLGVSSNVIWKAFYRSIIILFIFIIVNIYYIHKSSSLILIGCVAENLIDHDSIN